jgi:hypothetical protein
MPPVFAKATVPVVFSLLRGGFAGRTITQGKTLRHYWKRQLHEPLSQWLAIQRKAPPPIFPIWTGEGGTVVTVGDIIERIHHEFPLAHIYTVIALDDKQHRRIENGPEVLGMVANHPFVSGNFLLDDLHFPRLYDRATEQFFPGMFAASLIDTLHNSPINVLADLFAHSNVVTLSACLSMLPVTYRPAVGRLKDTYVTDMASAQARAIQGIHEVLHNEQLQSVPLPRAAHAWRYVLCVAPIIPESMRQLAQEVRDSGVADGANVTLAFASTNELLHPTIQEAPMIVIGAVPIEGGVQAVKEYVHAGTAPLPLTTSLTSHQQPEPQHNGSKKEVSA